MRTASAVAPAFEAPPRDPRLLEWLKDFPPDVFSEQLYQSVELLERYSIELAVDLVARLDLTNELANWRSANEICDARSFQPRFRTALNWILQRLVETGCVETRSEGDNCVFRLRTELWKPQFEPLRAAGIAIDPANAATLDLLDHAANLYPSVARGEQSADASLFEEKGVPLWLQYFANDNLTYAVNNWVSATAAADRLAGKSRLRILELGAGAGSASEALIHCCNERGLLPALERFLITEPNAFFRRRAQRRLSQQYPNVPLEWSSIDINSPFEAQGVASGFDLVFAVNVLHVAKNLLFSLNEARTVLAPSGWIVLGECVRPFPNQPMYPELVFQILESFTDVETDPDFRPNPGFLTAELWQRALERAGFGRIETVPDLDKIRGIYPHFFTGAICGQTAG